MPLPPGRPRDDVPQPDESRHPVPGATGEAGEAAVSVRGLDKHFGDVRAVHGMTWGAHLGRITAVLGPNGAGKTTTVACLEGLLRPDAGEARVLGVDPWGAGPDHRAAVGVMLQDGGLSNTSTPARLIPHLARLYADPWPLDDLTGRLGIRDFEHTSVRRLSGGQRQRVALAAALVGRPRVAFLDEPSAGLDPHARLDVWELVREVAAAGACVVLTTHSFEEAERLADDLVVVADGHAVATGTVAEVADGRGLEETYFTLTRPGAHHDGGHR
ncbi:ABC transporter ATP-binding protein [Mobilicoccus pelagius]|uniref:Putative ABC transporter ATP-binding protein n=1 Tax=Mobilicoccus pelagius NBRC 104925 TaxID=1089455 RepID=H5UTN0_9MICO|nr:ABC transporter ATP-binding protein [Mobilicoccus pelagius]GAB49088.1 putative ABC transporter ATP-binding protein [Mobilicoccus pelagius NBRC 104925]